MRLNKRYQIIQSLSSNPAGETFLAIATHLSPPFKCVIQQSGLKDSQDFHSFSQTLQTLCLHPQVPTLLEAFQEAGKFYLVQEFISGKDLKQTLTEEGLFTSDRVIGFLRDSLAVLKWLHDHQVIHGDLKPTNLIYRTNEPQLVLVDFRSARLLNYRGTILGDPQYSAPEQLQGKGTYASDLYSLGTICLHLLTGMLPFDLLDRPLPQIPNPVSQILERLVEPDVSKRFQSAKDVLSTMQRLGITRLVPEIKVPVWQCYATLNSHSGLFATVNTVAISPDSRTFASGSDDRTIGLGNFQTTEKIGCLEGNGGFVKSIAFSPDGRHLASGNADGTIQIWDLEKQTLTQTLTGHEQAVNAVIYSPTGQLISGSVDKTIKLWNQQTVTFKGHNLGITAIALHPQQPLLATASLDRTVKLWHLDTLKPIYTLKGHTWAVRSLSFSPFDVTGKMPVLLATGGDDNLILLWDCATRQVIRTISGHSWAVTCLCFTQDGRTLISGSWDKTIKLWHVATGKLTAVLEGHTDSVCAVAVHPAGSFIVSGSKDRTVKLWQDRSAVNGGMSRKTFLH